MTAVNGVHNIMDYGAVLNNTSTETCNLNSAAIEKAFDAAITSINDREVLIPVGNFYSMPIQATNASYINFTIDGTLWACSDNKNWPTTGNSVWDFMNFTDMNHFTIQGSGVIDGQGFMWWQREYVQKNPAGRPNLTKMQRMQNLVITGVKWQNAPYYHMKIEDSKGVWIYNMEIYVDVWG